MIRPLGQRILVREVTKQAEQNGLLLVNRQEANFVAEVVAVGASVSEPKVGDRVLISRSTGVPCAEGIMIGVVDVLAIQDA